MKDWETNLDNFFEDLGKKRQQAEQEEKRKREEYSRAVDTFLASKVVPAFKQVQPAVEKHGRDVWMNPRGADLAAIEISYQGQKELNYVVHVRRHTQDTLFAFPEINGRTSNFRDPPTYTTDELSQEDILQHLLSSYKSQLSK